MLVVRRAGRRSGTSWPGGPWSTRCPPRAGRGSSGGSGGDGRAGGVDVARLVHHAAGAGDTAAILRYAPDAARDARRNGAHREAAAHYRVVLEHAETLPVADRATYQEEYAVECYTLGLDECAAAQVPAVELRRQQGDRSCSGPRCAGCRGSLVHRRPGGRRRRGAGGHAGADGVGRRRALALALSNQSQLAMLAHRHEDSAR